MLYFELLLQILLFSSSRIIAFMGLLGHTHTHTHTYSLAPCLALIQSSHDPATYPKDGKSPETIAYSISISLYVAQTASAMCKNVYYGYVRTSKKTIFIIDCTGMNEEMCSYCAVIASIMSTVAVCLKDTMWTLDIHTHTVIWIYIFVVSGNLNLLPPVLSLFLFLLPLIFPRRASITLEYL